MTYHAYFRSNEASSRLYWQYKTFAWFKSDHAVRVYIYIYQQHSSNAFRIAISMQVLARKHLFSSRLPGLSHDIFWNFMPYTYISHIYIWNSVLCFGKTILISMRRDASCWSIAISLQVGCTSEPCGDVASWPRPLLLMNFDNGIL